MFLAGTGNTGEAEGYAAYQQSVPFNNFIFQSTKNMSECGLPTADFRIKATAMRVASSGNGSGAGQDQRGADSERPALASSDFSPLSPTLTAPRSSCQPGHVLSRSELADAPALSKPCLSTSSRCLQEVQQLQVTSTEFKMSLWTQSWWFLKKFKCVHPAFAAAALFFICRETHPHSFSFPDLARLATHTNLQRLADTSTR